MVEATTSVSTRRPGRKRDDGVRDRAVAAAIDVFTVEGWAGFSLDAVARKARVGKSSIYLRWPSREALLRDVVQEYWYTADQVPAQSGNLREDLLAFARSYANVFQGPRYLFGMRALVEGLFNEEVQACLREVSTVSIPLAHDIIRRAKRRGEISKNAPAAVMLDSLLGGLMHHSLSSGPTEPRLFESPSGVKFIEELVDSVIGGAEIVASRRK